MKKDVTITLKITEEERRELDRMRRGISRSTFIRDTIFGERETTESGMTKADENNLKLTAMNNLMLRKMVKAMGKDEIISKSKTESEEWFDKKYNKKNVN